MDKIGGQAVIEGVMMKSTRGWTVAVRDPRGEIHVKKTPLRKLPRIFRMPMIRGVITLFHTLTIGIMALEYSATKSTDEEEEQLSRTSIALTIGFAFLLGIVLFIILPLYAAKAMGMVFSSVNKSSILFNLADGVVRVGVFLLYILLIGLWGEVARIFEYHGAEHKAIHALEAGEELEIQSVREHSPQHPRCGTSFLMIVMVMSILIFSMIPQSWPFAYKALARIVLLPLIAGVSYEALKLSARMKDNAFVRMMIYPGLLLQRLTTKEPDDAQIEVAITALKEVLSMEEEPGAQEA